MFGLSIWELLIVLAIVVLVFGTARFKNLGSDLGSAIKGFRSAIKDDNQKAVEQQPEADEGEAAVRTEADQKANV